MNHEEQFENKSQHTEVIYSRTEKQRNDVEVTRRKKGNETNILELYLNDVYERECVFKVSKEELEFIQTGIETLVQKIVDLVIDSSLPYLKREYDCIRKERIAEVYFNINKKDNSSHVKIARSEIIKVGSFYEGTKNNFPDEFDFIFPILNVQEQRDELPPDGPLNLYSSIQEVTNRKTQPLKFKPDEQKTVTRKLYFDQYLRKHGPAALLRFIYINSTGYMRKIHVNLVPAYKITPVKDDEPLLAFPKFFSEKGLSKQSCLWVSRNYSFTETELHFMRNILSEKHSKVYRILKFLINRHGDGEILKLVIPNCHISSYQIKVMMIYHHEECRNPVTDNIGYCVIQILEQMLKMDNSPVSLHSPYLAKPYKALIQSLTAAQVPEDTYSYDQVRMKSVSRQVLDGQKYGFWLRYLDTLGEEDPRMDSFEQFLDAENSGWREWGINTNTQWSETKSNQLNLSKQRQEEIVCYKVPLACWPKLHNAQKLVTRLIVYSHDMEDKSKQQEARHDFPSEHVDILVRDKTFDIACLSIKPENMVQKKTEWYCISENVENYVSGNFTGILVDSNGVKLVQMMSESTIFTDRSYGNKNIAADIQQSISNMIEIAIFKPLLEKVKLLHRLQGEIEEDETQNIHQVKRKTEKTYEHEISLDSAVFNKDIVRKKKRNIERLLGEMIALVKRSSLPESLHPVIGSFETRKLSKQVTKGLFEIDQTIKYCGYRYNTLHIKVEPIPCSEESQLRKDQIERFLLRNGITNFRLDIIESQIKEYFHVGAEIQSEYQKKATLGCFSIYTKGEQRSFCGLLSKHLVLGSSKIFVGDKIHFGTVLPNTNNDGGHDISAAEIVKQHTQKLDPTFKDFEHITKPAYVLDKFDIEILQDQPVYLRGAMTKLGVGTIQIPQLESRDPEITHLQLIGGNYTMGEPDGKLAVEGDSGAIVCTDVLDPNKICLLSMLMGELLPNRSDKADKDGNEKEFMSLRLSSGLRYLEEKTQGKFTIEETMTYKDNGDKC